MVLGRIFSTDGQLEGLEYYLKYVHPSILLKGKMSIIVFYLTRFRMGSLAKRFGMLREVSNYIISYSSRNGRVICSSDNRHVFRKFSNCENIQYLWKKKSKSLSVRSPWNMKWNITWGLTDYQYFMKIAMASSIYTDSRVCETAGLKMLKNLSSS